MATDIPDWLTPGSAVVVYQGQRFGDNGPTKLTHTTVSRVSNRSVALVNGDKFQLNTLRADGYGPYLSRSVDPFLPHIYLFTPDHPWVMKAGIANQIQAGQSKLRHVTQEWMNDHFSTDKVDRVRIAAEELAALLAEVKA